MGEPVIGVGMIGLGTVGSGVAALLTEQAELYRARLGARLELRRVLVRDAAKAASTGVADPAKITTDADVFFATPDMPIVIEVAGGKGVVSHFARRTLSAGKHLITANKSLLAAEGPELFALARKHNVSIAFEASCGGGIPIITGAQFGLMANRIDAVYGILNGTCNYILTEMVQKGKSYSVALIEAQEIGYAEADPTLDVSGRDAAQKLAVFASLVFGVKVSDDQVWSEGIDTLDIADIRFGGELGYNIKLLAIAERVAKGDGALDDSSALSLRVHPCFISKNQLLANVNGSFNAVSIFGHANGHTMYYGRGAGRLPTASAVISDLINVASGWYPAAFKSLNLWSDSQRPAGIVDRDAMTSRYYLRMNAIDVPGSMGILSTILGDMGISISSILQHEVAIGQFVPLVITTHTAREGAIREAMAKMQESKVVDGRPVCIRIVDFPEG